ncbi:MAG TPA: NosD domain-containing protein [Phycisphaerales bacterium]|nr:NosD domain-containing protein [Phycisphaerales bacterium]
MTPLILATVAWLGPAQPEAGPGARSEPAGGLPTLTVTADDTPVSRSCRVVIPPGTVIADLNGDGVLHVNVPGVTVEFAPGSVLVGAGPGLEPDAYTGWGVRVDRAEGVTIRGAVVRGYRAGIYASKAPGLTLEGCDVSGNFRQRLRSTVAAEDASDWLWPHRNDQNEWLTNYGAGICIEESDRATVRGCRAREGQNGLILDRVNGGRIYDNDFSFLSGWGLALWRSSGNLITRNALDFCVRGYSHGIYNRGQDSAGILMFEQCSGNVIAENSATHGGDGLFCFAGREALGEEKPATTIDLAGRGCNDNLLYGNDFSYAAAHGIEVTFSFGNRLERNRLVENNICGVWGGYSQNTLIYDNLIEGNGPSMRPGWRGEGGGINIEHGHANRILANRFRRNAVGVSLWWDDDAALLAGPWARANYKGSSANEVSFNTFDGDQTGVRLVATSGTRLVGNIFSDLGQAIDADEKSEALPEEGAMIGPQPARYQAVGEARPVGARGHLAGRDHIVMGPWGPWDHQTPLLRPVEAGGPRHQYDILGVPADSLRVEPAEEGHPVRARIVTGDEAPPRLVVEPEKPGVTPYRLRVTGDNFAQTVAGTLIGAAWTVRVFPWQSDPRTDEASWQAEARGERAVTIGWPGALFLPLGGAGPRSIPAWKELGDKLPGGSRYGIIAETTFELPAGRWRITTLSDDGVRVTLTRHAPGRPERTRLIERWTHHGPERDAAEFTQDQEGVVGLLVEYFQLDGHAVLELGIEPANQSAS